MKYRNDMGKEKDFQGMLRHLGKVNLTRNRDSHNCLMTRFFKASKMLMQE